jgi:hypothetical protein
VAVGLSFAVRLQPTVRKIEAKASSSVGFNPFIPHPRPLSIKERGERIEAFSEPSAEADGKRQALRPRATLAGKKEYG